MNVPKVGDEIELTRDWEFDLYDERRNSSLIKIARDKNILSDSHLIQIRRNFGNGYYNQPRYTDDFILALNGNGGLACKFKISKNSKLKIDRIYIRKGDSSEFDSMSFILLEGNEKTTKSSVRFWAKLEDCNKIYYK